MPRKNKRQSKYFAPQNSQGEQHKCDHPGCNKAGEYRAPKNARLKEYYRFCLEHVQEYNAHWNYYENEGAQDFVDDNQPKFKFSSHIKYNFGLNFDDGYDFWEQGEVERKAGNIEKAIELYDKARYNGYLAPALYKSYVMAYKKLNDIDNQIAILDEAIERLDGAIGNSPDVIPKFEEQRRKLIEKLNK